MIKRIISLIVVFAILFSFSNMIPISAEDSKIPMIYLKADGFQDLGTWKVDGYKGSFNNMNLIGLTPQGNDSPKPDSAKPAVANFKVEQPGEYKVWARTRDFSSNQGTRFFQISINGKTLGHIFGKHAFNGWKWEDGGTVSLTEGDAKLELLDTSAYWPRVDGILLVRDAAFVPSDDYNQLLKWVKPYSNVSGNLEYPEWAKSSKAPDKEHILKNDKITIKFFETTTEQGNVIQNEIYINHNGELIQTHKREDGFGYLLMYAKESKSAGGSGQYPAWNNIIVEDGKTRNTITSDIFKSGAPKWLIPSQITMDGLTVTMVAENDVAKLNVTWKLQENSDLPLVNVKLTTKVDGAFSLGMFNGPETESANIDYILNSYKLNSQRIPTESNLVTERFSTSGSTLMTVNAGERKVTYAAAVDPSCVPYRWAYADNSKYGLGILGAHKGVQPYIFAPLFGQEEATMKAGGTFEFAYRPVTVVGEWYDAYSKIVREIYGVNGDRTNYYSSLTEAANNMAKLVMDDDAGGWDARLKAHYNMEGRNVGTHSDPLELIQMYLLTGDKNIYESRSLPTLEFLLSRKYWHFTATGENQGGTGYLDFKKPSPIGDPMPNFGTDVFGGAYMMTRGQAPMFRKIGIDGGVKNQGMSPWMPKFAEYVWYYNYTGDEAYLKDAKKYADEYIANTVDQKMTDIWGDGAFVNNSAFPYWSPLLDLYEVCGEQKYLDAAARCARMQMATLWTQPMVPDGDITIKGNDVVNFGLQRQGLTMFFKGDVRKRLGVPENQDKVQDETVPASVVSRIGLGIEQPSTFIGGKSSQIYMANWAPDFLRLARYTKDDLFETIARNAIIGRWSNYPGYYVNQFMSYNLKPEYPYQGPDLTNIYYHHIPIMLGLAQDYLITQAWKWSDGRIVFPSVRQQGYVWFNNKHYGFEAGRFFDESEMWLWLKAGLIKPDSKQIDWIAARKDGAFGVALMNEDIAEVTTTVTLGDDVTGGNMLNGTAVLYNDKGEKSETTIENNQFKATIPAHGMMGVAIKAPAVKKPEFANAPLNDIRRNPFEKGYTLPSEENDFGKGAIIQIDPSFYDAYLYVTDLPDVTSKVVLNYKVGDGQWQKAETILYPYEFSIGVNEADKPFEYYFEVYDKNGGVKKSPNKTLYPAEK